MADRAWRFLDLSHAKRQGEHFVLASACHQLEPGGGQAVAERLAEFQCEDLQRADQAVQLDALGDLIAGEMREVIVEVRTDQGISLSHWGGAGGPDSTKCGPPEPCR